MNSSGPVRSTGMKRKIAIVGAGALGGHVGGYLAKAGQDVTLIDPWPEHVEAMRTLLLKDDLPVVVPQPYQ